MVVEEAEYRPDTIPCLVLPESEIVGFLGYRHITGIQEWSPLAKARYLERLWDSHSDGPSDPQARLRWVARKIGSKSDYVARLLTSLALFKHISEHAYYGIDGLDEETLSFSLIALAMNRPSLTRFIGIESGQSWDLEGLDEGALEELTKWFFEEDDVGKTRLGESRNVSALIAVIDNPSALDVFRSGVSLSRAYRMTQVSVVTIASQLADAQAALETASAALISGAKPVSADLASSRLTEVLAQELRVDIERALA
jgi:hypothetical protein